MSGLDKMKNQILDEANHSAEAKIAEAKAKAEEIIQAAKPPKQKKRLEKSLRNPARQLPSTGSV